MAQRGPGGTWLLFGLGIAALALLASSSPTHTAPQPLPPPPPPPLTPRETELLRYAGRAVEVVARFLGRACPPLLYVRDGDRNAWSDGQAVYVNLAWLDRELRDACLDQVCETAEVHCIMAHEMAHHVLHHAGPFAYVDHCPANHAIELEADRVAGWVMAHIGVALSQPFRVLSKTAPHSCTHPQGHDRLGAYYEGVRLAEAGLPWWTSRS